MIADLRKEQDVGEQMEVEANPYSSIFPLPTKLS
jgi:hypothetical protein